MVFFYHALVWQDLCNQQNNRGSSRQTIAKLCRKDAKFETKLRNNVYDALSGFNNVEFYDALRIVTERTALEIHRSIELPK